MTLEERVSALLKRVEDLERKLEMVERRVWPPDSWRCYPPLNDTRNPERGGLDSVMADEGYVVK